MQLKLSWREFPRPSDGFQFLCDLCASARLIFRRFPQSDSSVQEAVDGSREPACEPDFLAQSRGARRETQKKNLQEELARFEN
jgi:hypothetical protein